MLNIKKLLVRILKTKELICEESITATTAGSGWVLLKHNNANIRQTEYEVISAYESTNRIVIPFVSGNIWYAKVLEYTNMAVVANTSVTIHYTLRKVGRGGYCLTVFSRLSAILCHSLKEVA